MAIEVGEAKSPSEKEALYRFRYRIYVEEQRWRPVHADHERKLLMEPIDAYARNFFAAADGRVVGSLRINLRREGPLEFESLYDLEKFAPYFPDHVSMSTKFAIAPERRGGAVLRRLLEIPYRLGRELDVQFNFLDCHPHLINLYEYLGYRRYRTNINHPEAGYMTPMVLVLQDLAHLERVGSPLAELARSYENGGAAAELFARRFPLAADSSAQRFLSTLDLWSLISEKLSGKVEAKVPLFAGLDESEIQALIGIGNLINCKAGDRIVGAGEQRREIYTLLNGSAEAQIVVEGSVRRLGTFGAGETFGEMAFLAEISRSADVVALEDCEVLVHPADRLETLAASQPKLASKFYRNLSRMLSLRLNRTMALLA